MWAERFTRVSTNLQDLEDAITGRIGSSLKIELVKAEVRHIAGSLAADNNPLDERLHAMALVIGPPTQEKYLRARQYIEESLEKDQNSKILDLSRHSIAQRLPERVEQCHVIRCRPRGRSV